MFRKKSTATYLDWASAAPVSIGAEKAFLESMKMFGNPSSPHAEGEKARVLLEDARKTIARLAEVKTDSVIFTSGATEANALAIQGHIQARINSGEKLEEMHILYLPTAHSSVVDTIAVLGKKGAEIEPLTITDSAVDLSVLKKQLRKDTVMVCMDLVCGETGNRYDTRDVRRVIEASGKELRSDGTRSLLQVDASQAPLVESFELIRLGADLLTLDAQKVGGVRGTGALIRANAFVPLASIMQGGGQEQGLRPGTENVAGAVAFATALSEVHIGRESFKKAASDSRTKLLTALGNIYPDMQLNSGSKSEKTFVPHIVNVSFPGRDTDYAVMLLSKAGFAVSTKSACETDAIGSRVVYSLTNDESRALSTVRISWGPATQPDSLRKFANELIKVISFLDAHSL